MAIIVETFYINNTEFTRTYSDANRYVVRDGVSYSEACDPAEFGRTYTEGDLIPYDERDNTEEADYAEAGRILLGEETK